MAPGIKGPTFAHCKSCNADVNVAHSGVHNVKKHLATSKHKEMVTAASSSGELSSFFFRPSPIEEAVTRALKWIRVPSQLSSLAN